MKKVGFIGAGNMGYAIMKGISLAEVGKQIELFAYEPDSSKTKRLTDIGVSIFKSEAELTAACDCIFFAVKPQIIAETLDAAKRAVTADKVLVSIAAGVSAEFIRSRTLPDARVILVMPNTPLLVGEGASALARSKYVTDEDFDLVMGIFASCGLATEIPEDKMKEVIAVNSSSPAFIYLFAKGFIDYAQAAGIDSETALSLFAKTLVGSAKMLTDSGNTVDELIKMVSSPGGTTLAGLSALYDGELTKIVGEACERCTARAYELGK